MGQEKKVDGGFSELQVERVQREKNLACLNGFKVQGPASTANCDLSQNRLKSESSRAG